MRGRAAAALLVGAGIGWWLSGCFAPTYTDCAFLCGPQAPVCPAEYECRADGYCHLPAGTAVCIGPVLSDLSAAADASPDAAASD